MFGIAAKSCIFLLYVLNEIRNVTANPRGFQNNNFKCIRLNEPPYFYCNLFENIKRNDEINVRITPENVKESYPVYPYPPSTTTVIPESSTSSIFVTNESTKPKESIQETNFAGKSSLKFENDFSTTEKSPIFTTTVTSGFSAELSSNAKSAWTTTMIPLAAKKDDDSFIISELSKPLPSNRGPTIMEELFIDTLTKSSAQAENPQQQEKTISFESFHNELLLYSNRQLFSLCRRFLPFAREHCHREWTYPAYISQCRGYFQDCERFILRADPLTEVSRGLQMNVRYGNPGFPFRSVQQYY